MRDELPHTIIMTGATGFLGHYILRDMLNKGQRVVVILRAPLGETADRLRAMMDKIGLDVRPIIAGGRLVPVEGALPDKLPAGNWGRTDGLLHCAASLQLFSNGNGDPYATNVAGAEALIRWAGEHGVPRIFAVSTAYTCGWNSGVIKEEFHLPQPRFQTDYESSKWKAELLLKQWAERPGHVLTIFRPSFLIGDSTNGYTTQFGGFYQFARLVSALKEKFADPNNGVMTYIPLRIPGRPHDPQNFVPVDYVARVIAEVLHNPEFHGRIYHLTNPEPPTNDLMKRCCEEYFGLYGGCFTDPQEMLGPCSAAESLLWDQYHLLTPRVAHNPRFDVANTRQVLEKRGIEFPLLDRRRIFMLFDYAAACGWGRQGNGFHG